jgi:transcriptional regulator with XRE-family HTH domain
VRYFLSMAPKHDWYLKEWLTTLGKKQADVCRDLDWNKARISLMLRGVQPYDRDSLNELADYLSLRPHELLMHPSDAMALRALRAEALKIAHSSQGDDDAELKKVS